MAPRRRRPRGHIEELPSHRFRAIVYAGTDPLTGRTRQIKQTAATYAEAEVALTKLLRQVDEQQHPKSVITVREALEQWIEVADLEVTTRERYEDLIRLDIGPRLGHLQAGKLDAEILERFYARLHTCRELCSGKPPKGHTCRPLSSSTTRKIHYILRGALEREVRWRYLSVNPAELVAAPAPRRTKPDPPSAHEAAVLISNAWRDPGWGLLLWLTMVTGFRRGELCSLRWRHLDLERRQLWVERSTAQTSRAGVFEKETKTDTNRRTGRPPLRSGLRQLALGAVALAVTYGSSATRLPTPDRSRSGTCAQSRPAREGPGLRAMGPVPVDDPRTTHHDRAAGRGQTVDVMALAVSSAERPRRAVSCCSRAESSPSQPRSRASAMRSQVLVWLRRSELAPP